MLDIRAFEISKINEDVSIEDNHLILLSGGINSTVLLAYLKAKNIKNVEAVFFYYHKCSINEKLSAEKVAKYYGVKLDVINLFSIYEEMAKNINVDVSLPRFNNFYIPYRNGTFISVATAVAYYQDLHSVLWGISSTSSSQYPDTTQNFIEQQAFLVNIGTYKKIKLVVPFYKKSKTELVKLGIELKAPLSLTWSCINSGMACGKCFGCLDRFCAFAENNLIEERK